MINDIAGIFVFHCICSKKTSDSSQTLLRLDRRVELQERERGDKFCRSRLNNFSGMPA